jgi:hypothetical protein
MTVEAEGIISNGEMHLDVHLGFTEGTEQKTYNILQSKQTNKIFERNGYFLTKIMRRITKK